jgi:hypothetical protein
MIMKYQNIIFIGITAIIAMLLIGGWFFSSRGDDGSIVHPSPSGSSYPNADAGAINEYDYTEAPDHIGERATVSGTVLRTFTAKSGVTFFDFCDTFDSCPFSAVIFSSDASKFGDLSSYERPVKLTGAIKSYQGRAEMVLSDPSQIE